MFVLLYEDKCDPVLDMKLEDRWKAPRCHLSMLSHSDGHLVGRRQEGKGHSRHSGCGVVSEKHSRPHIPSVQRPSRCTESQGHCQVCQPLSRTGQVIGRIDQWLPPRLVQSPQDAISDLQLLLSAILGRLTLVLSLVASH